MSAEESIRRVVNTYVQRVDAGRIDDVIALFTPDGVLEIAGQARHEGHAAIRAMFERGVEHLAGSETMPRIRHHITSHLIEVDGAAEARSTCYWLAVVGAHGVDHWGRYADRLVVHDDNWRFAHRKIYLDGAVAGGWGARGNEWNA